MTLEEAARMLDKTRSSLGRVEMGQSRADVHLVRSRMDLYHPDLVDLAREAAFPDCSGSGASPTRSSRWR
ncbi:hypothetical protein [Actinophytocola oryzae]|uniref:Helix-turn-helix protein n=1 Tax=Actinophytocola oryzae TaxID=502181 RepID=A0A4R7VAY1_9PSEU|nr:hypothetical protein [Actinophytocola oryzae]TDV46156.1 hypothetical protein CLV71_111114 [Actinophytocola oryzae]